LTRGANMETDKRQKRVASAIQEAMSRLLIQEFRNASNGLITVTGVEMTADLKTARVFLSLYGALDREAVWSLLEKRKGFLRKALASLVKLKYNPSLIFSLDRTAELEERLDRLIELAKKR